MELAVHRLVQALEQYAVDVAVREGIPVFFFQAEDGIRDLTVTGVQTCALPISSSAAVKRAVEIGGLLRTAQMMERDAGAISVAPATNGSATEAASTRPARPAQIGRASGREKG